MTPARLIPLPDGPYEVTGPRELARPDQVEGGASGGPAQRKLILCMSMSLDGFVARRDGVIDWLDASVERRVAPA
jgi:hypothetical protein